MKKRIISLALALILCLALAAPAMADDSDFSVIDGWLVGYHGPGGAVTIPSSVTNIGDWDFQYTRGITSVTIPDSVTRIGSFSFVNCYDLASVNIPSSITEMGEFAFDRCSSLTNVTIADGVPILGVYAFSYCTGLKSVTIPGSVKSFGMGVFSNCESLANVTISDGVPILGEGMFMFCKSLESVTIPNSVTVIGQLAFAYCDGLKSVTIPGSVTSIGSWTFSKCPSLTDIYFGGTKEQWKALEDQAAASSEYGYGIFDEGAKVTVHCNSSGPAASAMPETPTVAGFTDVAEKAYYAEPVKWAVEKGITKGTSATGFSPEKTCNTAEILTFLWRACDKPDAPAASFSDVAANAFYADAASWAKSKGMVSGSVLSPETPCTRASAVMFIWQAMGKPAASKAASFTDVPADADYAAAVAWAVEKGVTKGTGDTAFSPDDICTRGHIVTFLHRAMA